MSRWRAALRCMMAKPDQHDGNPKTNRLLETVIQRLDTLIAQNARFVRLEEMQMAGIDDVITRLGAEKTVVDSISTGVDAAVAKLAELRALVAAGQTDPAKIQAALDAIDEASAQLQTKSDAIVAATVDPPVIGNP